jgi:pilus assembly protein Flp/PilA
MKLIIHSDSSGKEVIMRTAIGADTAQGLVEYALILVLVALVVIGLLMIFGVEVGNMFSNIVQNL